MGKVPLKIEKHAKCLPQCGDDINRYIGVGGHKEINIFCNEDSNSEQAPWRSVPRESTIVMKPAPRLDVYMLIYLFFWLLLRRNVAPNLQHSSRPNFSSSCCSISRPCRCVTSAVAVDFRTTSPRRSNTTCLHSRVCFQHICSASTSSFVCLAVYTYTGLLKSTPRNNQQSIYPCVASKNEQDINKSITRRWIFLTCSVKMKF